MLSELLSGIGNAINVEIRFFFDEPFYKVVGVKIIFKVNPRCHPLSIMANVEFWEVFKILVQIFVGNSPNDVETSFTHCVPPGICASSLRCLSIQ